MIIHTTILSTEALVISIYGGTTWIQHSGYFLRGADSSVTNNSAIQDGGNDDLIVPYHNHSFTNPKIPNHVHSNTHGHGVTQNNSYAAYANGTWFQMNPGVSSWLGVTNNLISVKNYTGNTGNPTSLDDCTGGSVGYVGSSGNATNANIPKYKNVYIWERTA